MLCLIIDVTRCYPYGLYIRLQTVVRLNKKAPTCGNIISALSHNKNNAFSIWKVAFRDTTTPWERHRGEKEWPKQHRHTHSPRTNSRRSWLIMVVERVSYRIKQSHVITNRRSFCQRLKGASDFFTMPIHKAPQGGGGGGGGYQTWIS